MLTSMPLKGEQVVPKVMPKGVPEPSSPLFQLHLLFDQPLLLSITLSLTIFVMDNILSVTLLLYIHICVHRLIHIPQDIILPVYMYLLYAFEWMK